MKRIDIKDNIDKYIKEKGLTCTFEDIYDTYCANILHDAFITKRMTETFAKFKEELEWLRLTMKYDFTVNYSFNKKQPNGKSRSKITYYVNGVQLFQQKIPFDSSYEHGYGNRTSIYNEYILGNNIYQNRSRYMGCGSTKEKERNVKFCLSKDKIERLGIPSNFKLEWMEEGDKDLIYPIPMVDSIKLDLVDYVKNGYSKPKTVSCLWAHFKDWGDEKGYVTRGSYMNTQKFIDVIINAYSSQFKFRVHMDEVCIPNFKTMLNGN